MAKYDRRKERDSAIGDLSGLADEAGLDKVGYRAGAEAAIASLLGCPPLSLAAGVA